MNLYLILVLVLAGFVTLLLVIAMITRKSYHVTSEISLKASGKVVFDYLKNLKNQDNFSKWALMDPNMKKEFEGIDGTVGFISKWESNNKNVGKGEQEIIDITEGERIEYEIRFIKPFRGKAQAFLSTDLLSEEVCLVTWGFSSQMNFPMNLMLLFMNMEKMIGKDLDTGLNNLKKLLEKEPELKN